MGTTRIGPTKCMGCGRWVAERPASPIEERSPCPNCGSTVRRKYVSASDTLTFHESIGLVQHRPGFRSGKRKRPVREVFSGDEQSADGTWVQKVSIFDREGDRRIERVVGPGGEVLVDVDKPLHEHKGHGSDRFRR